MEMFLEVDSVLKYYSNRQILSDVYLKLKTGNIVAVWGRNGSGKSTLFKIVFGSETAEHMFLRINDNVIKDKAYRTGLISYLPQFNFIPKNLFVARLFKHVEIQHPGGEIEEILKGIRQIRVGELSGGMRRLVEVIFILNIKTPFIILDEPFASISPIVCEHLCNYIKLLSGDKGIIVADHNYRMLERIADRHYLLDECCLKSVNIDDLRKYYFFECRSW